MPRQLVSPRKQADGVAPNPPAGASSAGQNLASADSRHPAYRERVRQLESNRPDDLWYDDELGWAVTYRMTGRRTLGFAVSGPAEVTAESRVYRAYECREVS